MKKKRFVIGTIIVVITFALLSVLYLNYTAKLDEIFDNTKIVCNEAKENCEKDLKRNVVLSNEAKSTLIYTSILTLIVLNASAYSLYYLAINPKKKSKSK